MKERPNKTEADGFRLEGYGGDGILRIRNKDDEFIAEEENFPDDNEFQDDRMGGLTLKKQALHKNGMTRIFRIF